MRSHAPDLSVAAFIKGYFKPAGGNGFPLTNRRVARPQPLGFIHALNTSRQGGTVVQRYAVTQFCQRRVVRLAFNLHKVNFPGTLARLSEPGLEHAVIGEHQQPFAVTIQTPGRVDSLYRDKILQRAAPGLVGKLRQYIVGFIEQYDPRWLGFWRSSGGLS